MSFEEEPAKVPDTEGFLLQLQDLIENARKLPMSASVSVNRDDFVAILNDALVGFPEEIREARWLLKDRDAVLDRARAEADRLVEAARVRAARLVEKEEVTREARRVAEQTVEDADREAEKIRHEAEDYVDRKLAAFEVVLDRTMQTVQKGRERLHLHAPTQEHDATEAEDVAGFFDQDDL